MATIGCGYGNMTIHLSQTDVTLESGNFSSDINTNKKEKKVEVAEAVTLVDDVKPDGGLEAWLQVVGSFFLYFNTW